MKKIISLALSIAAFVMLFFGQLLIPPNNPSTIKAAAPRAPASPSLAYQITCNPAVIQDVQVNQTVPSAYVIYHDMASLPIGGYVVVFSSPDSSGNNGIFAQLIGSNGQRVGNAFPINQTVGSNQIAAVTGLFNGYIAVVWQSVEAGERSIFLRYLLPTGQPITNQIKVHQSDRLYKQDPAIAALITGQVVVAWRELGNDTDQFEVYARIYESNGSPTTDAFMVNVNFASGDQANIQVQNLEGGQFLATWDDHTNVYGKIYNPNGTVFKNAFRINTTTGAQLPKAILLSDASFLVAWTTAATARAQVYTSLGNPYGAEINLRTTPDTIVSLAALPEDNFLVTWFRQNVDIRNQSNFDAVVQRYDISGNKLERQFRANTRENRYISSAKIVTLSDGNIAFVYEESPPIGNHSIFTSIIKSPSCSNAP